jgi:hypothetical protein
MTFTYTENLSFDPDFVRFHTGDTTETESLLSDAIISSLLDTETSKYTAVIAGLRYMKRQMMRPDFRADWLSVSDYSSVVAALDDLIKEKQSEFGLTSFTSTVTHVYRADSAHTQEPDYD